MILGHLRKAMKPSSRLLIVEMVLPTDDAPHPSKMLDMMMLVLTGGQERREAEYDLKADFHLNSCGADKVGMSIRKLCQPERLQNKTSPYWWHDGARSCNRFSVSSTHHC